MIIKKLKTSAWKKKLVNDIHLAIERVQVRKKWCSIFLTAGGNAEDLYKYWRYTNLFKNISDVNFYLTDERLVPVESLDSNYNMIMRSLFKNGLPNNCNFIGRKTNSIGGSRVADFYNRIVPEIIDIVIISVAVDGHIASLFQGDIRSFESVEKIIDVRNNKSSFKRITITPKYLSGANYVFAMTKGSSLKLLIEKIHNSRNSAIELPCKLLKNHIWYVNDSK